MRLLNRGKTTMATRIEIGETGWLEINSKLRDAVVSRSVSENENMGESLAAFLNGEAEADDYDSLVESDEDEDEDEDESGDSDE